MRYKVVRNLRRGYGYAVQDTQPEKGSYFTGPQNTAGWYRLKSYAQEHADTLNEAEREKEEP